MIDSEGNQLGVISKEEALQKAGDVNLDLVEIAPNAKPPVARILDFEKFRYEESKKEQAAKKRAKDVELKELWLTPRIAQHDIDTRLKRVGEFLKNNNKVMLRVKFRGRELGNQALGFQVLNKMFEALGDQIIVEREPKFEGRSITAIIGRNNGKSSERDQAQASIQ